MTREQAVKLSIDGGGVSVFFIFVGNRVNIIINLFINELLIEHNLGYSVFNK